MRVRPLVLLALLCLGLLALRPDARLEGALERVLGPSRYLAQVTWPIARLGRVELRASEAAVVASATGSRAASAALLERWYAAALPRAPDLVEGRRLVPGEVLGRSAGGRDQLLVRPWSLEGLSVGLPAVVREAYIGRIAEVDTVRGIVRVDLVTGRESHVGARVLALDGAELARLVVGGVATGGRPARGEPVTWLAAHHPSRTDVDDAWFGARVVVDELLPELDPFGKLAAGYGLGAFARGASDGDWRVEPIVDFLHGLSSLVLLAPGTTRAPALPDAPPHPLEEPLWVAARGFTAGDPSPWRASVKLDRGLDSGLRVGAAVVRGARLVGRLGAVSASGSTVRLLADPGLELSALAELEGRPTEPPRLLGRLVALGSDPQSGRPRFLWRDVLAIEHTQAATDSASVRARLTTAAGDLGLPAGLYLGVAMLPLGSSGGAGHVIELEDAEDALRGAERLFVRQVDPRLAGLEGPP